MGQRIAILGWGSLCWDPRALAVQEDWKIDGPELPLEFSRVSADGRLTLVIDPAHGKQIRVLYISSARTDISDAICDLRHREGTSAANIGAVPKQGVLTSVEQVIENWRRDHDFDWVIWTALGENFDREGRGQFTLEGASRYLQSLPPVCQAHAIEYIDRAPHQIQTPLRTYLRDRAKQKVLPMEG